MSIVAFIGVGSNLGNRKFLIDQAKVALSTTPGVRFLRAAPLYETESIGGPPQGRYLNTVWEVETDLGARELLAVLLSVESRLGRRRAQKNEPRLIDLDLLFFGDYVIEEDSLTVPHPRLHERWFVLKPLQDLHSNFVHPVLEKNIDELLTQVNENCQKS